LLITIIQKKKAIPEAGILKLSLEPKDTEAMSERGIQIQRFVCHLPLFVRGHELERPYVVRPGTTPKTSNSKKEIFVIAGHEL
jgi:hypothetical protein